MQRDGPSDGESNPKRVSSVVFECRPHKRAEERQSRQPGAKCKKEERDRDCRGDTGAGRRDLQRSLTDHRQPPSPPLRDNSHRSKRARAWKHESSVVNGAALEAADEDDDDDDEGDGKEARCDEPRDVNCTKGPAEQEKEQEHAVIVGEHGNDKGVDRCDEPGDLNCAEGDGEVEGEEEDGGDGEDEAGKASVTKRGDADENVTSNVEEGSANARELHGVELEQAVRSISVEGHE